MILGTAVVLLAVPFYLGAALHFGVEGLAWAGVVGMTINGVATLMLARRLHGAPSPTALLGSSLRAILLAGAAWAGAHFGTAFLLGRGGGTPLLTLPASTPGAMAELLLVGGIFTLVALALLPWLGDPELRAAVLRRTPRRFRLR